MVSLKHLASVVILSNILTPCGAALRSYWDFNHLSGQTFHDAVGESELRFRCDLLAGTFHKKEYVSGVAVDKTEHSARHEGCCLYLYNLKPEHGVYPEHAFVEIGDSAILEFGKESFTITGWFKKDRITAGHEVILCNLSDAGGIAILVGRSDRENFAGKLMFEVKGTEPVSVRSDGRVDDYQWHWFGAVSDAGRMRLYVDGVLQQQTGSYDAGTTTQISGEVKSRIGDSYTGYLDEIAVYDEALSDEALTRIYEKGVELPDGHGPDVSTQKQTERRRGIDISEKILFDGWKGESYNGLMYRLACGATITELPNGELAAWCLTGSDNEPASDNCVLMTRSRDGGRQWSKPEIFLMSKDTMMVGLNAMYPLSDGRIVAFWSYLPAEKKYTEWLTHRMYSKDGGKSWGLAERFKVGDDNAAIGRPLKLANCEYLFTATVFQKRQRPLAAPVSQLLNAKTEAEAMALPAGEGRIAGEFATHLWGCGSFLSSNEDGAELVAGGIVNNRPLGLLEPACVQLKDGRVVMLMRAQFGNYLWRAESTDNGRTWTDAWQTDILNPASMPFLVRLSDGRIALLNNNSKTRREPLSIWISDDEMESWSVKEDILYGGALAYPYGLVLRDGRLVFVYDHNRRQMRFVEVQLPRQ